MFDDLFVRKSLNVKKALLFGFEKHESNYKYETNIFDGMFQLHVVISSAGNVDTNLFESDTGEEYVLYKTNSIGSFVGEVRTKIEDVLIQVANNCYDIEIFKSPQTKEVISYVRDRYGDDLEYLWKKFPDNAVWRRKDTKKWYGAILTVAKNKLGIDSSEIAEIIDLRIKPEKIEELLSNENYYPGWHMNKKNWYTIILDNSVNTEEIYKRIDESYRLAL
ncbi:MAG: MmcQ/YjbR family DNA-binding protein [Tyzzerella sp.]|nr:MmcQ/YjbR family DNA-binding protein [Tyzzerella sp.]